jgi:hypothetical protein
MGTQSDYRARVLKIQYGGGDMKPSIDLLDLLIQLYADQNGVTITYKKEKKQ